MGTYTLKIFQVFVQALFPDELDVQSLSQPEHGLLDNDLSVVMGLETGFSVNTILKV